MKTLVKHYTASLRTALRNSGAGAFYMLAMRRSHSFEGGDISGVPVPFAERTSPTKPYTEGSASISASKRFGQSLLALWSHPPRHRIL